MKTCKKIKENKLILGKGLQKFLYFTLFIIVQKNSGDIRGKCMSRN